jgi:hypothetical protein
MPPPKLDHTAGDLPARAVADQQCCGSVVGNTKLFGEIVLKNRKELPFSEVRPAMQEFAKALKTVWR